MTPEIIKLIVVVLATALGSAGAVMIFGISMSLLTPLIDTLTELSGIGGAEYLDIMLRALGIALISQITSGICRDCGEESVAGAVEFATKLEILVLCIPLISRIIEYAGEIVSIE